MNHLFTLNRQMQALNYMSILMESVDNPPFLVNGRWLIWNH